MAGDIPISNNFDLAKAAPIDGKLVVDLIADLANIDFKYAGLPTYVKQDESVYVLQNDLTTWIKTGTVTDLSDYVPKSGAVMDAGAALDFNFTDGFEPKNVLNFKTIGSSADAVIGGYGFGTKPTTIFMATNLDVTQDPPVKLDATKAGFYYRLDATGIKLFQIAADSTALETIFEALGTGIKFRIPTQVFDTFIGIPDVKKDYKAFGTNGQYLDILPLGFYLSDNDTELELGFLTEITSPKYDINVVNTSISLITAPDGSNTTFDLFLDGVSILSTKITVEDGEFTSEDAATQPVLSTTVIPANSKLEVRTLTLGSADAGAGAMIYLYQI